jgi:hypothetical protein
LTDAEATKPSGERLEIKPVSFEEDENPSALYLGDWLAYYGPIDPDEITRRLGMPQETVRLSLEDLVATERIISGDLVAGAVVSTVCDASNFESLLRIARADAVPDFEALPIESLRLFLAKYQGITQPQEGEEGLCQVTRADVVLSGSCGCLGRRSICLHALVTIRQDRWTL